MGDAVRDSGYVTHCCPGLRQLAEEPLPVRSPAIWREEQNGPPCGFLQPCRGPCRHGPGVEHQGLERVTPVLVPEEAGQSHLGGDRDVGGTGLELYRRCRSLLAEIREMPSLDARLLNPLEKLEGDLRCGAELDLHHLAGTIEDLRTVGAQPYRESWTDVPDEAQVARSHLGLHCVVNTHHGVDSALSVVDAEVPLPETASIPARRADHVERIVPCLHELELVPRRRTVADVQLRLCTGSPGAVDDQRVVRRRGVGVLGEGVLPVVTVGSRLAQEVAAP